MKVFLWTMLVLYLFDAAGKLLWLANGECPPRTPKQVALDLFAHICLIGWMVALLAGAF